MTGVGKLYAKGLHKRFSYLATWLPSVNLKLGDYGRLDGEMFTLEGTLADKGVKPDIRRGENPISFDYASESGISVMTKAAGNVGAGTALPLAQAGVSIKFSSEGAFLFQANGCMVDEIKDKAALGQAILGLLAKNEWDPDWAVVDTIVRADCATILVSNSKSAALDLTANVPITGLNLANVGVGLQVKGQSGDIIKFIADKGLVPLYKLSRLRRSWVSMLQGKPGEFRHTERVSVGIGSARGSAEEDVGGDPESPDLSETSLVRVIPKWE